MNGDEQLLASALSAQYDIERLYPPYLRHYANGRHNLTVYDSLAAHEWKQCPAISKEVAKSKSKHHHRVSSAASESSTILRRNSSEWLYAQAITLIVLYLLTLRLL
ncbi:unnamed protein product [Anisakis simplex]|uniref:KTSC domain-containing protein n=1 Tax=Anisakis simplex TaxID=6269 RepID=A0A0M3JEK6_ANISI|nr:unnamed protein product [Anisakis simplex]